MDKNRKFHANTPRMLVTGASGMTGFHVPQVFSDYNLELTDKTTLDVRMVSQVRKALKQFSPEIVLHLAAETDIDLCERDHRHSFLTNTVGTQNIALLCNEINALLVYFSTTSVFPGLSNKVYTEFDSPAPIHIHGLSKWQGEQLVPKFTNRFLIVRPGWMFGGFTRDKKFVGTLRKQIVQDGIKNVLGVMNTKGSPTYALDCLKLTRKLIESRLLGTFNVVNSGHCTRFEMAELIAQHYRVSAEPTLSDEFKANAQRPLSEMVHNWMLEFYGFSDCIRDWKLALREYLEDWDKLGKTA